MKKYFFLVAMVAAILSCNTKKSEKEISTADTSTINNLPADSSVVKTDSHYFWSSDYDPKQGLMMKRIRPASDDSLSAPSIIQMLNDIYPEMQLRLHKLSHDSIFVKVGNSKYLTQQMGSSGPEAYFAEVTYNLTEIKGINFVDFNFKEGDHAAPATYSRTDFVQVKF